MNKILIKAKNEHLIVIKNSLKLFYLIGIGEINAMDYILFNSNSNEYLDSLYENLKIYLFKNIPPKQCIPINKERLQSIFLETWKLFKKIEKINNTNDYEIIISFEEWTVINKALELYSRLGIGDFKELKNIFSNYCNFEFNEIEMIKLIKPIRAFYFKDLKKTDLSHHYSIFSNNSLEKSKIAYDIIQVIRYKLAYFNNPNGENTIDFNTPLKTSNLEFINCTIK